ncbi:MAG: metallopeptidase [Acidobacteria bacterium]|nr:metallopeptidase [Acidobacteriota bacterium]
MTSLRGLFPVLLLLLLSTLTYATREERVVTAWQPVHYEIALSLDDRLTEITKARVEITLHALRDKVNVIDLDFGDMPVDSVTVAGQPAKIDRTSRLLNVYLAHDLIIGDGVVIVIEYHGRPKDGLVLAADKDGKPSATGDNWPNRVHNWIPCLDHPSAKATVNFTVTAPGKELVVANGKLVKVFNATSSTRTWSYSEGKPIPAYCMVIAVGEYAKAGPATPSITPLFYYVPQSDAGLAVLGFSPAAPSLKFFSEMIAPYPYEKLDLIVGATRFGGMENSSAIVFASNLLGPRNNSRMSRAFQINEGLEQVIAHEIAHQWFGDSVTEATWSDLWLSEGFATYFAGLFVQKHDGEDAFQAYMKRAADTYFTYEGKTRTPIHDTETEDLMQLLNANNYQKGAWVLHMLRSELGDKTFFAGLRKYYAAHKDSNANTDSLRAALEKESGKDLRQFFTSWVYGTGHPQYELTWKWLADTKRLRLTLKQLQREAPFINQVPIELVAGKTTSKLVLQPTSKEVVKEIKFAQSPTAIKLDPNNTILKEASVKPADR